MRLADRNFVVMLFGIFKAVDICIRKANISTMFDIEKYIFPNIPKYQRNMINPFNTLRPSVINDNFGNFGFFIREFGMSWYIAPIITFRKNPYKAIKNIFMLFVFVKVFKIRSIINQIMLSMKNSGETSDIKNIGNIQTYNASKYIFIFEINV